MTNTVYTIGHSTHQASQLVQLLQQHCVTAIGDVRSQPYSRINPQFNREELKRTLTTAGISYVFLGVELGARSDDPDCYENGRVRYDRLARTPLFQQGLERVIRGSSRFRLALMCAEKEPLDCHRTILVSRHLVGRGLTVHHILADGTLESNDGAVNRLVRQLGLPDVHLFTPQEAIKAEAYDTQEERIAYTLPKERFLDTQDPEEAQA